MGPAKLPCYKRVLLYPTYNKVPLYLVLFFCMHISRVLLLKVHRNQKQLKFAFILVLDNFSHSFRFLHYFLFILTK